MPATKNPGKVPRQISRHGKPCTVWVSLPQPAITKETAPCCLAKRDELGRLPVGLCGPDCVRRVQRDEWFQRRAS